MTTSHLDSRSISSSRNMCHKKLIKIVSMLLSARHLVIDIDATGAGEDYTFTEVGYHKLSPFLGPI